MSIDVCIVGAGLAGLSCAKILSDKGIDFCIYESQSTPGGRVQTDNINGYLCDRGFQVLLPAYPTAEKMLDYTQLDLCYYPKGALTFSDSIEWFAAPFMMPKQWQIGTKIPTNYSDWLAFATDFLHSKFPNIKDNDVTTYQYLKQRYSKRLFERFLNPFFQGVLLDQKCDASAKLFRYYWRLFAIKGAAIPANGMGQIPSQLIKNISSDQINYNSKVTHMEHNQIYFENGSNVKAKKIILATDYITTCKLVGYSTKTPEARTVSTYFYTANTLNKLAPLNFIRNATPKMQISIPTLIANTYSPNNKQLCMVTCIGGHSKDSNYIKNELSKQIGDQVNQWELIHYHHIDYAVPTNNYAIPQKNDYYFCGDWQLFGSIESAMKSGVSVANDIYESLNN
tara:strand:- start:598 stop:1785 length:1188 start_codon:yes stop_codon:yes gene_type:complete